MSALCLQDFENRTRRQRRAATSLIALLDGVGKDLFELGQIVALGAHIRQISRGNLPRFRTGASPAQGQREQDADVADPETQFTRAPDEVQPCDVFRLIAAMPLCGAFAEFERSMIKQRINAGLKRAVEQGKTLGRPKISPAIEKRIKAQLQIGKGMLAIARDCRVGTGTVQRIKAEMKGPFVAVAA